MHDNVQPTASARIRTAPASGDAPLMRVDAPQVSRTHVIRLLDSPGATLTVQCPDWCESDHYEDMTHGTFLDDIAHRGREEALHVDLGDGTAEDVLMVEITHYPFGRDLRTPTVVMWPTLGMTEAHKSPDELRRLADHLRQYADALDDLSVDLENIREQATAARRADHEGRWTR